MTAVAIDGPAGAGKSTVARAVADALGWDYVDSGAMYRVVALAALDEGIPLDDERAVAALARRSDITNDGLVTTLDSRDVSDRIRAPKVSRAAAKVARHPEVRGALLDQQRLLAERRNVVMEGRDIGTKVLPDAQIKVFLTASLDERAKRRALDLGVGEGEVAEVKRDIEMRDTADETREAAPLVQAPDAVIIDTTDLSIDEVVAEITALVDKARR